MARLSTFRALAVASLVLLGCGGGGGATTDDAGSLDGSSSGASSGGSDSSGASSSSSGASTDDASADASGSDASSSGGSGSSSGGSSGTDASSSGASSSGGSSGSSSGEAADSGGGGDATTGMDATVGNMDATTNDGATPGDAGDAALPTFTVGGSVAGLTASGLVLQDNAGDNLAVTAAGAFVFPTAVATGSPFNVTVLHQPGGQLCAVSGGTGTIGSANVTSVTVNCGTNTFTVSGTITGLSGSVVLENNLHDDLTVTTNGGFAFATPVLTGTGYSVTVKTEPSSPSQTCTVLAGSGTVTNANITGVLVTCTTNTYTVSGTISGLAGPVVLQDNGTDNLTVVPSSAAAFTFARPILSGGTFAVTVLVQPSSPTQSCSVTAGTGSGPVTNANVTGVSITCSTTAFTVGGTISGLSGSGLVLTNGSDSVTVPSGATGFTLPLSVASGATFDVAVGTQPSGPTQVCNVSGGSGTIGSSNVTGIVVNCATNTFTVGGRISGLSGSVVLRNNGTDALTLTSSGTFAFAVPLSSGASYSVAVLTQPSSPTQTCAITGTTGTGTVGSSNVTTVLVSCTTNTYTIGGTVTGLANGASVGLLDNSTDPLSVVGTGSPVPFTFAIAVASGASYGVTVTTEPTSPSQTCVATGVSSGTVGGANISNIAITCTTNTYSVGGSVSLLSGSGLVLEDNLGDDLAIAGSGPFTFPTKIASGAGYSLTVKTQPSSPTQFCSVASATGTVGSAPVTTMQVNCSTTSFSVGGMISNLAGTVTLQDNGGANLPVSSNGSFSFPAVPSGSLYDVTVVSQPTSPSQTCSVTSGAFGQVTSANITSVMINCVTNSFTIGGSVSGLVAGDTVGLADNGAFDSLSITGNGQFTFAKPIASGQTYGVTVTSQPTGEFCTATSASGTVAGANVIGVTVSCVPYASCLNILQTLPASPTGQYSIVANGTVFPVYCDMTTSGGGWTEIVDQDTAVSPGYQGTASWAAGLNTGSPNSGQYSILNLMTNVKSAANYEFIMDWPALASFSYVHWTQVENPLTSSQTPTLSNLTEVPASQLGCGAFRGLATATGGQPTALHGDSSYGGCWWWAVGTSANWNGGIPSYQTPSGGWATSVVRLWLR